MKRKYLVAVLMLGLGAGRAANAQEAVPDPTLESHNVATVFSATPPADAAQLETFDAGTHSAGLLSHPTLSYPAPTATASSDASPTPTPAPDPTFIYGGRDDYRWQLGIGVDWLRFRSSIFNASAVGLDSSVTYFLNDWFGVEGNVVTGFAPQIFDREHVKLLVYGGGPKIAWRENKWEPWMHAIVGGAHEQPQTADGGRNAFAVEVGGGADYRFNPRFSGRLEADWVRTSFFSQSQNNFKLAAGVVFHF
ncbi:MAG TPA: hypothetical protein VMI32_18875 [Candidatus Solibacter sp.]|nr:hypothetical protein [Candidatus Solibacter sp.]